MELGSHRRDEGRDEGGRWSWALTGEMKRREVELGSHRKDVELGSHRRDEEEGGGAGLSQER